MTNEPEPNTRAGEALKPFKREERFIVVKRKHLSEQQERDLREGMRLRGVETVECVVVESDWPEYETVWQMIEARVTGNPRPLPQPSELVEWLFAEIAHGDEAHREWLLNALKSSPALAQIAKLQADCDKLAGVVLAVVTATRAYLPPDGIDAQECLSRIIGATDNPEINPIISEIENGPV